MSRRNTCLLSALVIILIYFVITKPINYKKQTTHMTSSPKDEFTYGGVPLRFNKEPNDMRYYKINTQDGKINVPDSDILINKELYKYDTLLVPKEKEQYIQNDLYSNMLDDGTHFCDIVTNRLPTVQNNGFKNRFCGIKESYFD